MKLLELRCPVCARPLSAENDDLVVACAHCHSPIALDEEQGLRVMEIRYAAPEADAQVVSWLPMWLFQGQVSLHRRETQGRDKTQDAERFWSTPRYFYIPAWAMTLRTIEQLSMPMLARQPVFRPVAENQPGEIPLQPAVLSAADAEKLAEFLVLEMEAQRDDWLKTIAFDVTLGAPALWALPAGPGNRLVVKEV
jgi:hypothetical protein